MAGYPFIRHLIILGKYLLHIMSILKFIIYYKFFQAIRDFNIKFGLSTSAKRDKKDKIKTLTVRFTEIRNAIYHLSKGLDDSKDSTKPYKNTIKKSKTVQ